VFDEYERELRELDDELEPLAKNIEEIRASLRGQIRDIETRSEELRDTIDELTFRFRVGEFEESVLNERLAPFADECERLMQRHKECSDSLARIDSCEAAPDQPEAASRQSEAAPRPHEAARPRPEPPRHQSDLEVPPSRQADMDTPPAPLGGEDMFVDPKEWVEEFLPEDTPAGPAVADAPPSAPANVFDEDASREFDEDASRDEDGPAGDAHDPLSELADPDDELAEEATTRYESGKPSAHAGSGGLPILTITKGPATGKSLPLLPMTMTLGREVDNNIEIRDMNVARYHARISFEAGKYVIRDLEGSPGTFVDDQKITKAALNPGAVIRVGGTELKFSLG
jgi:hypothetical protein